MFCICVDTSIVFYNKAKLYKSIFWVYISEKIEHGSKFYTSHFCSFVSSPEPIRLIGELIVQACILCPSIHCPLSISIFKGLLLWSWFLPYFTYSSYRQGGKQIFVIFVFNPIRTLVVMVTYSCHWLIMGKVEIVIYFCLTTDIFTKVLQKCFLSSPLHYKWILSKHQNLICCHGNQNVKFAKKY